MSTDIVDQVSSSPPPTELLRCNTCALAFDHANELYGHLRSEHIRQPFVMLERCCTLPLPSPPSLKLTIKSTKDNGFRIVPTSSEEEVAVDVVESAIQEALAETVEELSKLGSSSQQRDDCDSDTSLHLQLDDDDDEEANNGSAVNMGSEGEQIVVVPPTPPPDVHEVPKIRVKNDLLHTKTSGGELNDEILTNLFTNNDRAKDLGFTTVDPDFQASEMTTTHSEVQKQQQQANAGDALNLGAIQQLTHQVTRLQATSAPTPGGVQQQNVLINIQQFQPPAPPPQLPPQIYPQHATIYQTSARPIVYPPQGQPMMGVQPAMYPTNPGHPSVAYYPRAYSQQPPLIGYRPPPSMAYHPQHVQYPPRAQQPPDPNHGLMKPPPTACHVNQRPRMTARVPNAPTMHVVPQRLVTPRGRMPRGGGVRVGGGGGGGMVRPGNPRMVHVPVINRAGSNAISTTPVRPQCAPKRPYEGNTTTTTTPVPMKRPSINSTLQPGKNDDADCQVIAVTQKNGGPQIQSVQGNVPESNGEIQLNGSITLKTLEKSEVKESARTNQVASVLASRGITITTAGKGREDAHENNDAPIQINLNNSVSIIPKKMDGNRNTVDLTEDTDEKDAALRQEQGAVSGNDTNFECHLCPAKFETSAGRAKHRTSFHRTSNSPEFGVPIVDLRAPGTAQRLKDYGIFHYIPLPNENLSGLFALPIVSAGGVNDATKAPDFASKVLPLGPVRQLVVAGRTPTVPRSNVKN